LTLRSSVINMEETKEASCCCSSCITAPGNATALKFPASNSSSLQKLHENNSPSGTTKHASAAGTLTNSSSNSFLQEEPDEVDGLAPRTPPLSPKLPTAVLNAVKDARGVPASAATGDAPASAAATAAAELEGYQQVFHGKRVLIIVSAERHINARHVDDLTSSISLCIAFCLCQSTETGWHNTTQA
jgi:hypothetical protein